MVEKSYQFKVNDRTIEKGVCIVNFGDISQIFLVFPLLTLASKRQLEYLYIFLRVFFFFKKSSNFHFYTLIIWTTLDIYLSNYKNQDGTLKMFLTFPIDIFNICHRSSMFSVTIVENYFGRQSSMRNTRLLMQLRVKRNL